MMDRPTFKNVAASDWKRQIAERAMTTVDEVDAVLMRHAIEVQSVAPHRRRITFSSLSARGHKSGLIVAGVAQADADFDFEWTGLGPGLWVLASDDNSAGKSSLLKILRSAVRGSFPGTMKGDVWRWTANIQVEFNLDGVRHRVIVAKPAGSKATSSGSGFMASLVRWSGADWSVLYTGEEGQSFEAAMSDFFMQELGFEKFHAYQKGTDTRKTHGWASMGSALFITGSSPALFGEETMDGLSTRLIQLFIGLPWVTTQSAIRSSLAQAQAQTERAGQSDRSVREAIAVEIRKLEERRGQLIEEKSSLPDYSSLRRAQQDDDRLAASLVPKLIELRRRVAELEAEHAAAKVDHDERRNLLRQCRDEVAAGRVFRRLRPSTCPSCDADVQAARHDPGNCPLCGLAEEKETAGAEARIAHMQAEEHEAKEAMQTLSAELSATISKRDALAQQIEEIGQRVDAANRSLEGDDRGGAIERELEQVSGGISALSAAAPAEPKADGRTDVTILKVAEAVTEGCYKEAQEKILKQFSVELKRFAERIGVKNLQDVDVRTNKIGIVQGATPTTFGNLNPGEKLRFRIAAALAAVATAKWSGIGRHPGLVVIDSPASEEMSSEDFAAVVTGLKSLAEEEADVQIIVGAVMRAEISAAISGDNLRYAPKGSVLF